MRTLTPLVQSDVQEFIKESELIFQLMHGFGSPLNILFPQNLETNIKAFEGVLKENDISGKVFYARKVNKSDALVRQAKFNTIGLDVSSEQELKNGLASGFKGEEMEVTGPKNRALLILAIQHDILINIDNESELEDVIVLHKLLKKKSPRKILLRLTGFRSESTKFVGKDSRFGIPLQSLKPLFAKIIDNKDSLILEGFSFHLDTVNEKEKIIAIENCLDLFEEAKKSGFQPHIINIGGGFRVSYLESLTEWNEYISSLKEGVLGKESPLGWNNYGFGFRNEEGRIRGAATMYEFANTLHGADYLQALLQARLERYQDQTVAQILSDNMIDLYIEPGRALVDQTGVTAATVNFVKRSESGEILIGLNMNRTNLASPDQELFLDPIILSRSQNQSKGKKEKYGVYFIGNLCIESDMIYKHKTFIDRLPEIGDIVVFPNTSGYNMDFFESNTLLQPLAEKIAVIKDGKKFVWSRDSQYNSYLNTQGQII